MLKNTTVFGFDSGSDPFQSCWVRLRTHIDRNRKIRTGEFRHVDDQNRISVADRGFGAILITRSEIRGGKNQDPGTGMNIPDLIF